MRALKSVFYGCIVLAAFVFNQARKPTDPDSIAKLPSSYFEHNPAEFYTTDGVKIHIFLPKSRLSNKDLKVFIRTCNNGHNLFYSNSEGKTTREHPKYLGIGKHFECCRKLHGEVITAEFEKSITVH